MNMEPITSTGGIQAYLRSRLAMLMLIACSDALVGVTERRVVNSAIRKCV